MKILTTIAKQVSENIKEQRAKAVAKSAKKDEGRASSWSQIQSKFHLPGYQRPADKVKDFRELIDKAAATYGHLPAFHLDGENGNFSRPVSYNQFREQIYGLGTAMEEAGMLDGFVGVLSENRYEWCLAYLTIGAGGSVIVPLDKELGVEDLHTQIVQGGLKTLFYSKSMSAKVAEIVAAGDTQLEYLINMDIGVSTEEEYSMSELIISGTEKYMRGNVRYEERTINPEKLGVLVFTSGTTSNSKAVMLSQKNICANMYSVLHSLYCDERDTMLVILPLHHTYCCTAGFLTVINRGTAIGFCKSLKAIAVALNEFKPTITMMVPAILEVLYRRVDSAISSNPETKAKVEKGMAICASAEKVGLDIRRTVFKDIHAKLGGRLKLIISGAAAINPAVLKAFEDFGFTIRQGYGLTETSPIVTVNETKGNKYESVGRPLLGVEVGILNPNENGIGEIGVKGDNVMMGYYKNPEATSMVFKDGWFLTGDLGYMDKDGYLYISGRSKNVIVTKNGKNIYPEELETKLQRMDYVNETMVTGEEDTKSDDLVVTAQIYPDYKALEQDGLTDEESIYNQLWGQIKALNESLPAYKKIRALVVRREDFERTSTNKVKRAAQANKVVH